MELSVAEWQCFFASLKQQKDEESLEDFEMRRRNILEGTAVSHTPRPVKKLRGEAPSSVALTLPGFPKELSSAKPQAFATWLANNWWTTVVAKFLELGRLCLKAGKGWKSVARDMSSQSCPA
jgi:hypothetical protein